MIVLFDLQQEIDKLDLDNSEYIVPVGNNPPVLEIRVVDDVKTIAVENRADRTAGLGIPLSALTELKEGDRITVTGRVPRESPAGSWGVALVTEESKKRKAEECQLAQFTSPKSLFSLSHILGKNDLNSLIMVQTTRWGAINPTMNLFIDSILISRTDKTAEVKADARDIVYSFAADVNLQPDGTLASPETDEDTPLEAFLAQSGNPKIKVCMYNREKSLHVTERAKDWDGIDINLTRHNLIEGNKYQITVKGRVDGPASEGSIITLQGLPGYSWRNYQFIADDRFFTLCHVLSDAELSQWTTVRVTTNSTASNVSFYIFDIEIKRLRLL
jgi:hypothetical protein